MAVTSVEPIHSERSYEQDKSFFRTFTRAWNVITDDPHTGPVAIREAVPDIYLGQVYTNATGTERDDGAFVQKITIRDAGAADGKHWIMTAHYGPYDPSQFPANPIEHPIQVNWAWQRYTKPVDEDINGNAVVNSAGDYFDPPVERDQSRPVLRITRNEQSYDPATARAYVDHVNSDTFFGYGPKLWKCNPPTAELAWHPDAGGFYYKVNYEFELQTDPEQDGWKKKILDQGLRYLDSGTRKVITVDGQPASSPVPLDGSGGVNSPSSDPAYLTFDIYPEVAFSGLGFDLTGAPGQSF